jgi:hypothetical protein
VDVTDSLRPGTNSLEIRVANLWPNRLIADSALPEDQRVASTTWNPFKPDTPLLPSGLLGPVQVLTEIPPTESGDGRAQASQPGPILAADGPRSDD